MDVTEPSTQGPRSMADLEAIYRPDGTERDRDEDTEHTSDEFVEDLRQPVDHGYAGQREIFRDSSGAPILARELGRRLRRAQAASGIAGITLARKLGVSTSTVSRMMTGILVPTVAEAASVLALCGVSGETRDRILDLCHPRHDDGILRLTDGAHWDAFLFHSAGAARLIDYQPMMIPWVAQTYDYAAAWLSRPLGKTEQALSTSMDRPTAEARTAIPSLRPEIGQVELIVHEWALRTPVGDRSIELAQLRALLRPTRRRRPWLRVIPAQCELPLTALSGFTIVEPVSKSTLVYREDPTGGVFFDDPAQVAAHRRIVEQLGHIALDAPSSCELIERIIDEYAT